MLSECQGGRGCVLDALEVLPGSKVKGGAALHGQARCPFPIPHPHVPNVSPQQNPGSLRGEA